MTFLPIADRELRVSSRRHFTYWSRVIAAGFILIVFGMLMLGTISISPAMGLSVGQMAFSTLKWLAFLFACSAGIFLTSDSISEEKREGTLGLLFLTDLHGYDIVFGKLISQSLLAFFCLVAAFPILALPLLMGGVTGTEFGRSLLIICNTLFLSLAVGMFVSSISREVMKAMNATLLLSLFIIVGLPWIDLGLRAHQPVMEIASPAYIFVKESGLHPSDFWFYLFIQHLMAWSFLVLCCIAVPRAWQEKANTIKGVRQSWTQRWRFGSRRSRLRLRQKLLPKNPIAWLASRDRWLSRLVWLVVFMGMSGMALWIYLDPHSVEFGAMATFLQGLLALPLGLWISSQACRIFVEGIRSGAMELILVTPVTPRQIVQGQWAALWRTFFAPVLFIFVLELLNACRLIWEIWKTAGTTSSPPGFNIGDYYTVTMITSLLNLFTNLLALAWFGMWMGVTTRKTSIAVLKTLCFVFILPGIAQLFIFAIFMGFAARLQLPIYCGAIAGCVFNVVKNVIFIRVSRGKLLENLREAVARSGNRPVLRPVPLPAARVVASSSPTSP